MKTILRVACALALLCRTTFAATVMDLRKQDDAWFASDEGKKAIDNIAEPLLTSALKQ